MLGLIVDIRIGHEKKFRVGPMGSVGGGGGREDEGADTRAEGDEQEQQEETRAAAQMEIGDETDENKQAKQEPVGV